MGFWLCGSIRRREMIREVKYVVVVAGGVEGYVSCSVEKGVRRDIKRRQKIK